MSERLKTCLFCLWLALVGFLITHIHTDVTAIQTRLDILNDAGRIKPEYRR